ncbi:DUF397 domain-containing protein [Streptomyces rimosus]|uniref:DUF397 domain-containing protein n=1 Tax=Streptomyces rimosus TaxID=1927 RepID=UPI00099D5DF8|nr:DUF397 domain-containing protein [Streptomyces rimosus]
MTHVAPDVFRYVKSTHSGGHPGQDCIEVATNVPTLVAVRDSKFPSGPALLFGDREWLTFRAAVIDGRVSERTPPRSEEGHSYDIRSPMGLASGH